MSHVLIIEDHPMIALGIEYTLLQAGADTTDIVDTQDAAIDAAKRHRPDFITADVQLSEGLGPLAVQQIHRELGRIPVVFITATPDECRPCAPPGFVMGKPFNPRVLTDAFCDAVRAVAR